MISLFGHSLFSDYFMETMISAYDWRCQTSVERVLLYPTTDHFQRWTLPVLFLGIVCLWLFLQYFFKGGTLGISNVLILKSKVFSDVTYQKTQSAYCHWPCFLSIYTIFSQKTRELVFEHRFWCPVCSSTLMRLYLYPQGLIFWHSGSTQYIKFTSYDATRDFLSCP